MRTLNVLHASAEWDGEPSGGAELARRTVGRGAGSRSARWEKLRMLRGAAERRFPSQSQTGIQNFIYKPPSMRHLSISEGKKSSNANFDKQNTQT